MSASPEPTNDRAQPSRRGQPLWFWAVLFAMVLAFCLVLVKRDAIRSYWWAYRLAKCEDIKQQPYYINALMNVGEAGDGAVMMMSRHELARVRSAAVMLLAHRANPQHLAALGRLLGDTDLAVRESASRALGFMESETAQDVLISQLMSDNINAATAAAAGLSRMESSDALCALCQAIGEDPRALVRAQAVESLAVLLAGSRGPIANCPAEIGDPFYVLVRALSDTGEFDGELSLEREIEAARGAAASGNAGNAAGFLFGVKEAIPRKVCEIARLNISQLLGESLPKDAPSTLPKAVELADALRRHVAENSVRLELPASMPALPIHQP